MSADLTVTLNPRAGAALTGLVAADGCTDTDAAANRAIIGFAYLAERVRLGAELQLLHAGGHIEAVTFL